MKPIINLNLIFAGLLLVLSAYSNSSRVVWHIGQNDGSGNEFALAPDDYERFLEEDFGWEDRSFIIGASDESRRWPYVLPGPSDQWGGTSQTAGWRAHYLNVLFELEGQADGNFTLVLDVNDYNPGQAPLVRVTINGEQWKHQLPLGKDTVETPVQSSGQHTYTARTQIPKGLLREGGNEITITTIRGSWLVFDQLHLEGPGAAKTEEPNELFVRDVNAADYEIENDGRQVQPLLVDLEHIQGEPSLSVLIDGEQVFHTNPEMGRYEYEVPMPEVEQPTLSEYVIESDGKILRKGKVERTPQEVVTPSSYVNTMIGSAHSRWMIAPGPWMPFSMVKLSPDNQDKGWQAGYDPIFESIQGFSHIHEWTLAGLLTMPVTGPLELNPGSQTDPDSGYRSRIDNSTEEAPLGYYKVDLTDYDITAELTSTTRAGFQRYTFSNADTGRVMLDLYFPAEYDFLLDQVQITRVDSQRIEGYSKQRTPDTWSGGITQEYTIHFVAEFDRPIIRTGVWEGEVAKESSRLVAQNPSDAGMFVEFDTREDSVVQMRTGISYVSIDNASLNLESEITEPHGWDFNAIVNAHRQKWDELLGRIHIQTQNRRDKVRFYTNMYRSFSSRNTYSDVDGRWVDAGEQVRQFDDPDKVALGCDAFWNTFWNLNQLWNLAAPEWSSRWVHSQLAMYDVHGWLTKGPAGMEYIPVMVAEHEIPLIVGAWQMGIRDFDGEKALDAAVKMQTTPGRKVAGGYAGNRDLETYMEHHYVPADEGRFSNSLEYSFDDWTVSQLAKSLGEDQVYEKFHERGYWWRNTIDPETGYARMKYSDGSWEEDFDPFTSGAGHHYVEANAWQLTFFVPQDVPALVDAIGRDRFLERLQWGFQESEKWRYNAPNERYADYPVVQGNQQSMQFAFLFNHAGKPWLTQKWSRSIMDRYYGHGVDNAYLGDEDQGQMSAWFVMASLGLFQTDGGTRANPVYEIASPLYPRTEIDLGGRYGRGETFVIEANNVSRKNKYVQSATLNGRELNSFSFPASELLKGGKLELEMGPVPNKKWGN